MAPLFIVGDRVRLKADPAQVGLVTQVVPHPGGHSYEVFFSGADVRQFNESGLEPAAAPREVRIVSRDEFLRTLLLTKLDHPLNDLLYAYQASRTQFEAYQFKPVLKFLDAPVPALLIADEVGLGKTIEAAILYLELKARGTIRRVLVICPAGLRQKWQAELLNRFDEQFAVLRKEQVLEDIDLYEQTDGANELHGIVSLETIRGREVQAVLETSGVTYDLVIVDEAHHLRTAGRLSHAIGERMQELSENLVLLTATPLQTSQQDLFNLLRFVDPAQFTEYDDFVLQLQPNAHLNEAIRRLRAVPPDQRAALEALGRISGLAAAGQVVENPAYPLVQDALRRQGLDREGIVRAQRDIDSLNVLSSVYTRTKKADVAGGARRKAHVIQVTITQEESDFLDAVLAHARAEAQTKHGNVPGFVGIMRERQAASSIAAMREYLEESLRLAPIRRTASLMVEESTPDVSPEDGATGGHHWGALADLARAARALGDTDSKFDAFATTLQGAVAEQPDSKILVFTFFRRTLAYIGQRLRRLGYTVVEVHGGIAPDLRAVRIAQFRDDPNGRILLSSEVGSEGLDLQFCDTIFNYDLPWNPMRVEQRIGRIDRYGQLRDQVRIYSFFLQGTIEERILERLYMRIGIFEESIGDLEPILGPISADLTRDIFRAQLSPQEEAEVAERYANMIVTKRQIERELEEQGSRLLGQDALLMQAISDNVRSGRYVSKSELRAMVAGYLSDALNLELTDRAGDGTVLLPSDDRLRERIERNLRDKRSTRVWTRFLQRLSSGSGIPATFEGEQAHQNPRLEFLSLRHPIVQTAVEHYRSRTAPQSFPLTVVAVPSDELPADFSSVPVGRYDFALLLLTISGAQRQVRIVPVVFDTGGTRAPALEEGLLRLVQDVARDVGHPSLTEPDRDALETAARAAGAAIAHDAEVDARERNSAVIAVRRATIERTYGYRLRKRRALLASAEDPRIQRMYTGAVRKLEAALESQLDELEERRKVSVGFSVIAGGRLSVTAPSAEPLPDVAHARVAEEPPVIPRLAEPPPVFRP